MLFSTPFFKTYIKWDFFSALFNPATFFYENCHKHWKEIQNAVQRKDSSYSIILF